MSRYIFIIIMVPALIIGGLGLFFKRVGKASADSRRTNDVPVEIGTNHKFNGLVTSPESETPLLTKQPSTSPWPRNALAPAQRHYKQHISLLTGKGNPLHLTTWQIESIQNAYNRASDERERVELKLARVEVTSPSEVFIEIPKYKDEAIRIMKQFSQDLDRMLGSTLGPEFIKIYGDDIQELNYGFGNTPRRIIVDKISDENHFHVVESIPMVDPAGLETTCTLTSELRRENLVQYSHLKTLFPPLKITALMIEVGRGT